MPAGRSSPARCLAGCRALGWLPPGVLPMPRTDTAAATAAATGAANEALVVGLRARAAAAAPRQAQLLRRAARSVALYPLPLRRAHAALALEHVGCAPHAHARRARADM